MALSVDLRIRVIRAYEGKEGSMRELARRFQVGWITIWRWVRQYRLTGEVKAKPHGKGRRPWVSEENEPLFRDLLNTQADSTLDELRKLFQEKTGLRLSRSTTHRVCQRLGFTRKQKSAYAQEQDRPDVKKNGKAFRQSAAVGKVVDSFL